MPINVSLSFSLRFTDDAEASRITAEALRKGRLAYPELDALYVDFESTTYVAKLDAAVEPAGFTADMNAITEAVLTLPMTYDGVTIIADDPIVATMTAPIYEIWEVLGSPQFMGINETSLRGWPDTIFKTGSQSWIGTELSLPYTLAVDGLTALVEFRDTDIPYANGLIYIGG